MPICPRPPPCRNLSFRSFTTSTTSRHENPSLGLPKPPSRLFTTSPTTHHENPLGLPKRPPPPTIPRRTGPTPKRPIPEVKKVVAVASGKGGVGKSTVALNLAFALALQQPSNNKRLKVGILDLDIFGPSVPTLMGLQNVGEPELTSSGGIIPLTNHGIPCMSMGFLLPSSSSDNDNTDTPIVWRGLMVQKAVQQLLFDVDWSMGAGGGLGAGLDVLVVDMPPGTGDVPLTLGQLVTVDGAVIVSTPQDVALSDVRKGIAMLRKVSVPITGLILNQSYYLCPSCVSPDPQYLFGKPDAFHKVAQKLGVPILGELPLVKGVSKSADEGWPYVLGVGAKGDDDDDGAGGKEWRKGMKGVAEGVAVGLGLGLG